jgi:hypothetical protein
MVLIDAKIAQYITMADGPTDKKCSRKSRRDTKASPRLVGCEPGKGPSLGVLEIKPFISAISRRKT